MAVMFNSKNLTNFRVDGKSVNSIYFGGKKVLSGMLPSGTVLWSGSQAIGGDTTKTITLNSQLKDDWSNLKNGLIITYAGSASRTQKDNILKDSLFLYGGFSIFDKLIDCKVSKENKTITFTGRAISKLYSISVL